jgi:sec-independent protein translocase protein TatA
MHLGHVEAIVIAVVVLTVFGAGRLTDVGGALGKGLREFRQETARPDQSDDTDDAST